MKAHARDDSFSSQSQLMAGEHKSSGNEKGDAADEGHGGHDDHDFSEIVIHQVKVCVDCSATNAMAVFKTLVAERPWLLPLCNEKCFLAAG